MSAAMVGACQCRTHARRSAAGNPGRVSARLWSDASRRGRRRFAPSGTKATYYDYDASGLALRKFLGNESAAYYSYDSAGRLVLLKNARSDGAALAYFTYGRLPGGNVSRILREDGGTVAP